MDEKVLWSHVRRAAIEVCGAWGRWDRVENGVLAGMPDVSFCVNSVEGWVELKYARQLPGPRTRKGVFSYASNHGMSVDQISWHLRQAQAGGRSFILAGIPTQGYVLWAGHDAEHFNARDLEGLRAGAIWWGEDLRECVRTCVR